MIHISFDRSRIETEEKCPRLLFWQYYYKGHGGPGGITPAIQIPPPWDLLTGSAIHEGIEMIIKGVQPLAAAEQVSRDYFHDIQLNFHDLEDGEVKSRLMQDLADETQIVKALVYAWGMLRLPIYLQQFEPISIEQEESITFEVGKDAEVELLTRTDLLSKYRDVADPTYIIHNFKKVNNAGKDWRQQWRYDQQTLTEYIAVENRLGKQVQGVIIEGLITGKKSEYPEGSGIWRHNTPLIFCWHRPGEPPMTAPEWHSRYAWTCKEPHETGGKRSKQCPGGQNHRLSGVYKVAVEEVFPGGVIGWIDHLIATDREILDQQFVTLEPITRSDFEIERWKRQTLHRQLMHNEWAISVNGLIQAGNQQLAGELLDYYFPMHTGHGNCIRFGQCPMFDVCWGSADPADPTKFQQRQPNHPKEAELWQIQIRSMNA